MKRLVIALLLLCCASAAQALDPFRAAGIDRLAHAQIPLDLTFRDENGGMTSLGELAQGKPIVLAPVLHNCPNICGVTLAGLAQAIAAQELRPGKDFIVIAFGIDPNEGPADAKADLARLRQAFPQLPADGIHALTGSPANVAAATSALGYRYAWDNQLAQFAHLAALAVLTQDGTLSRWLYGVTFAPTDLKLALVDAGGGKIGSWTDQILLLCYHYDPISGRYGSIIGNGLRIGAGLTVLGGLSAIGIALWRERRRNKAVMAKAGP